MSGCLFHPSNQKLVNKLIFHFLTDFILHHHDFFGSDVTGGDTLNIKPECNKVIVLYWSLWKMKITSKNMLQVSQDAD